MADEYNPLDASAYDGTDQGYDADQYNSNEPLDTADEDDDYDPSSVGFASPSKQNTPSQAEQNQHPPATQPVPSASRPQKVAGFIVEESDDEPDELALQPSQLNGAGDVQPDLGTVTVSEASDVSLHSAPQDTAADSTSLNGSTTVPNPSASTSNTPVPTSLLQPPFADQGKANSPTPSAVPTPQPAAVNVAAAPAPSITISNGPALAPPARLPHDKVGQLEDRIKDDPKGDTNAWISLIDHYHDKGQHDFERNVFARFFKVFPTAVSMWKKQIQVENELDERDKVVGIFNEALMQVPSVDLWKLYLDHVRRALPLMNDTNGQNRSQILSAFDVTLENVGIDPDAGLLWREYIDFLKDGPGTVGGQSWQDLQKVDLLRKAYQRAIKLPHSEFVKLWKEYESFEMSLHKATGRKHIQEQSPHYMQCRTAKMQLDQKLEGLDRTSLPRLPPLYGCAGDDEFETQVVKWRAWIAWERDEDPLVYKGTEDEAYHKRVLYTYTQATMSLYFYPPIWFEAASWCFAQSVDGMAKEGEKFLDKGITANPESVLLALMKADRVESSLETGNTSEVMIRNGEKLELPYEKVHTALYALRNKQTEKDKLALAQIRERFANLPSEEGAAGQDPDADDDDDSSQDKPKTRKEQEAAELEAVKTASAAYLDILKRVISYVWVAKMQAFRRVQGQGKPVKKGEEAKAHVKGFRGIFGEARPRGSLSSDVYTASALMEWHCYRDPSAIKIFERGMKLFPEDEAFILEYIKHLIAENDVTNARVVFESTIPKILNNTKLTQEQKRQKCKSLFGYMHEYEGKYGDLAQIHKLEKRMAELYPDEPDITRFGHRFELPSIDAMDVQILLSPTQALPKAQQPYIEAPQQPPPVASIESISSPKAPEILLGPNGPYVASPKRPLEDSDTDTPQRKFMRGESPLKGAAGMRMQGKSGTTGSGGFATKTFVPGNVAAQMGPTPLPPQLDGILRLLPKAASYTAVRLDPTKLVQFFPTVNVEHAWALHNAGQLQRR